MNTVTPPDSFPFRSVLSLRMLIDYWEKSIQQGLMPAFTRQVLDYIDQYPELRQGIEDPAVLDKHKEVINFLMTAAIPSVQSQELIAANYPFQFKSFFATDAFRSTITFDQIEEAQLNIPIDMNSGKTIHACLMILEKFYNFNLPFDKPLLFTVRNEQSGLDKVYKIEIGKQFLEIVAKGPLKPIDPKIIKFLSEKVYDIDLWLRYVSPKDFEFHGFVIFRLVDVTEQEMLSSIKYDLLEKNAVTRKESFASIRHKLMSIFNIPNIQLGLAYFDQNNNIIMNSSEENCWKSLSEEGLNTDCNAYDDSIYERAWVDKRYVTIDDLEAYPFKTKVEESLLSNGVKSLLLAPLIDEDETIGMLELGSTLPNQFNPITASKVENLLPMFRAAVKRVKEEMATEVRAIIQEECTNIHPSVEWRFLEAGSNVMTKRRKGEQASFEEIVFKDVYPLYGLADVRNSSLERNAAIQQDLLQNLRMVKELLQRIHTSRRLPVVDEVIFKTETHLARLEDELASGDESVVLDFLRSEVNPLLNHFSQEKEFQKIIAKYQSNLDPIHGVVCKRRRAFEESITSINKMISHHLDEVEDKAQEMFPHYFEKYQTDGVEYTLYLGDSLVRDHKFDLFYLKNFRLWQLLLTCELVSKMEELKPKLKIPLDITQLILVHDQPLSIRFRHDEKQFDVDGAYDIRYEIVKKRIDKAHIKATQERLTQPGKIAVVYNHAKVEEEYRTYFEYLSAKGLITGNVERFDLEELPGANGLKAMRVEVVSHATMNETLFKNLKEALSLH